MWEVKRWSRTVYCKVAPEWSIGFHGWTRTAGYIPFELIATLTDETRPDGRVLTLKTWPFGSSRSMSRKLKEIADEWPRALDEIIRGHDEAQALVMEALL